MPHTESAKESAADAENPCESLVFRRANRTSRAEMPRFRGKPIPEPVPQPGRVTLQRCHTNTGRGSVTLPRPVDPHRPGCVGPWPRVGAGTALLGWTDASPCLHRSAYGGDIKLHPHERSRPRPELEQSTTMLTTHHRRLHPVEPRGKAELR
jgi:hypothetical protein